jgi:hypothetical protein
LRFFLAFFAFCDELLLVLLAEFELVLLEEFELELLLVLLDEFELVLLDEFELEFELVLLEEFELLLLDEFELELPADAASVPSALSTCCTIAAGASTAGLGTSFAAAATNSPAAPRPAAV